MTLADMVRIFENSFVAVEQPKPDVKRRDFAQICSGGIVGFDDIVPALYSSDRLAISAWYSTAEAHHAEMSTGPSLLQWVSKPELVKFQMTLMDLKQRHRTVSDRFAVKSQFVVERTAV